MTHVLALLFILTPNVQQQLQADYEFYTVEHGVEFAYCLYGFEIGTTAYIIYRTIPAQRGTWGTVSWTNCADTEMGLSYLSYGHSHPPDYPGNHIPSDVDIDCLQRQPVNFAFILFKQRDAYYITILIKS